jgi:hypothetical protein
MARAGAKRKIDPDSLAPIIRAGYTEGLSAEEALELHSPRTGSGVETIRHMSQADRQLARGGRRFAQFVAETDTGAVWTDGVTDRPQLDYTKTYTPEGLRYLREGRQCLRCDEPLDPAFPTLCPLCGYPVKERQIMDIAMEFEGDRHLGPRKGITEYMEVLEERTEKRRFIDRQVGKGSLERIPKDWLRDAHLFPDGPPASLR